MESSGPNRVRGDSRSRPNSPASVDEQGQDIGGVVNILQQIAQAL